MNSPDHDVLHGLLGRALQNEPAQQVDTSMIVRRGRRRIVLRRAAAVAGSVAVVGAVLLGTSVLHITPQPADVASQPAKLPDITELNGGLRQAVTRELAGPNGGTVVKVKGELAFVDTGGSLTAKVILIDSYGSGSLVVNLATTDARSDPVCTDKCLTVSGETVLVETRNGAGGAQTHTAIVARGGREVTVSADNAAGPPEAAHTRGSPVLDFTKVCALAVAILHATA